MAKQSSSNLILLLFLVGSTQSLFFLVVIMVVLWTLCLSWSSSCVSHFWLDLTSSVSASYATGVQAVVYLAMRTIPLLWWVFFFSIIMINSAACSVVDAMCNADILLIKNAFSAKSLPLLFLAMARVSGSHNL